MSTNQRKSSSGFPSLPEILEARIRAIERNLTAQKPSLDCPFCKQRLDEDYIICPHCLRDVKTNCPSCGELIPTGATFCRWCGDRIF